MSGYILIYAKANQSAWSLDTLKVYYYKAGTSYYLEIGVIFNIQKDINPTPEASFSYHFHS